jgi:hypothetical protein
LGASDEFEDFEELEFELEPDDEEEEEEDEDLTGDFTFLICLPDNFEL